MQKRLIYKICVGIIGLGIIIFTHTQHTATPTNQNNSPQISGQALVTRDVDGDTIEVTMNGIKEKVRLLGINTPETVDPRRPVECFGHEASTYTTSHLLNQSITLSSDPTQSNTDKYGRLLRYITLADGTDYNKQIIADGYAYEYTYDVPYQRQHAYRDAQTDARTHGRGLWAADTCGGKK